MKRILALILCGSMLALLFGACASKDEANPEQPQTESKSAVETKSNKETKTVPTASTAHDSGKKAETKPETKPTEAEKPEDSAMKDVFDGDVAEAGFDGVVCAESDGRLIYESEASRYSSDTFFRIASVSKQFTAAAVLMLCDEGRLSVNDAIDKFFPEFYEHSRYMRDGTPLSDETMQRLRDNKVTVHHLLCMRSGIPDYLTLAYYDDSDGDSIPDVVSDVSPAYSSEKNRAAVKQWLYTTELSLPDQTFDYSNSNYLLLGEIIEQVSGMPYEDFITERILEPLGMNNTYFGEKTDISSLKFAHPDAENSENVWFRLNGVRYGCGDMISIASDLMIWARELMDGTEKKVLTDSMISRMTTNYSGGGYGYGLSINENMGMISHEGSLPPFSSILAVIPSQRFALVMFDNRYDSALKGLSQKLCSDFMRGRNA